MSLLGFDRIVRGLEKAESRFLVKGIKLAQLEFSKNFNNESNSETGQLWARVKRHVPPKILVEKGKLRKEATRSGRVVISGNMAVLTVDPVDERGRGYAEYHQEGFKTNKGRYVEPRKFITQSNLLDEQQEKLLIAELDKVFL